MAKSQRYGGKSVHGAPSAYRSVDLDQSDVGLLVDVSDLGVERGAALQLHLQEAKSAESSIPIVGLLRHLLYLHSVLVGHHVSVGDDEPVLRDDKPGAAGHRQLPLGKHHPADKRCRCSRCEMPPPNGQNGLFKNDQQGAITIVAFVMFRWFCSYLR